VHIDPDYFKKIMPEWKGYISRDAMSAGTFCHRESAYIQEIAQEQAMLQMQNVWVDGSLRDGDWFARVFQSIRQEFPAYRIGIFYVSCSEEVVRQRVKERAQVEGRDIPEELLLDSIQAPATTLNKLTPLVDFVARIDNSNITPILTAFETVDHSGRFDLINKHFVTEEVHDFPRAMRPMFVEPCHTGGGPCLTSSDGGSPCLTLKAGEKERLLDVGNRSCICAQLTEAGTRQLHEEICEWRARDRDTDTDRDTVSSTVEGGVEGGVELFEGGVELFMSPASPITIDAQTMARAGIPENAYSFCFCSASPSLSQALVVETDSHGIDHRLALLRLLVNGGFAYFDMKAQLVSVSVLQRDREVSKEGAVAGQQYCFQFDRAQPIFQEDDDRLLHEGRWQILHSTPLARRGATAEAWILPHESIGGKISRHGGMAYLIHDPDADREHGSTESVVPPLLKRQTSASDCHFSRYNGRMNRESVVRCVLELESLQSSQRHLKGEPVGVFFPIQV
jgi:hypothetical protein